MEYKDQQKMLVKSLEQVRGVLSMMEEQRDLKEVIIQLSAIQSAVDKVIAFVVTSNLAYCLLEQSHQDQDAKKVKEAIELLVKSH